MLGLAAVMWMNTLFRQVQEQTNTLKTFQTALEKSAAAQEKSVGNARVATKEAALDTLLRNVRAGSGPEQFTALYTDAIRERDEAVLESKKQSLNNQAVFEANDRLRTELTANKKKAAEYKSKADEVEGLTKELSELKAKLKDRDSQLGDRSIFRKYDYAWYAAIAGWALCLVLALSLSTLYARSLPAEGTPEETPHTIT